MTSSNVSELVRGAQRSDPDAWERIYVRSHDRLLAYARAALSDPDAALGAVDTTFGRAYDQIGGFRGRGEELDAWLFGILRAVVLEQRAGGRASVEAGEAATVPGLEPEALAAAFAGLGGQDRELLELRAGGRLTAAEVASVTGRRPRAAKRAEQEALAGLRQRLGNQASGMPDDTLLLGLSGVLAASSEPPPSGITAVRERAEAGRAAGDGRAPGGRRVPVAVLAAAVVAALLAGLVLGLARVGPLPAAASALGLSAQSADMAEAWDALGDLSVATDSGSSREESQARRALDDAMDRLSPDELARIEPAAKELRRSNQGGNDKSGDSKSGNDKKSGNDRSGN